MKCAVNFLKTDFLLLSTYSLTVVKVEAHSYPVRSVPVPNQVTIWFSELPQAGFSTIDVFDQTLQQVDLKNSAVIADHVTVGLPSTLPNGTYTVPAVDGHHTTGAFVFAIGQVVNDSAALSVRDCPANLRLHIPQHRDAVIYQMIAQGYGAMPAMGAGLTPDER